MPSQTADAKFTRARAEALFKPREHPGVDAPSATTEYHAAQRAALERMHEVRRQRLARDPKLGRKG